IDAPRRPADALAKGRPRGFEVSLREEDASMQRARRDAAWIVLEVSRRAGARRFDGPIGSAYELDLGARELQRPRIRATGRRAVEPGVDLLGARQRSLGIGPRPPRVGQGDGHELEV